MVHVKKSIDEITWGADPEFFASVEVDGVLSVVPPAFFRTALEAVTEENANHPIFKRYGKTIYHEDGGAFEVSTPPSKDWREIWKTISQTKEAFGNDVLSQYAPHCLPQLFSLPSMNWQVERWLDHGPEFAFATRFGCDADEDAFNTEKKCEVLDASLHPKRYAGGHIHISGIKDVEKYPIPAIHSLAFTAGLASTAYSTVPELERDRLFLYGRPGKYRVQHYPDGTVGAEYRTPSTSWTDDYSLAEKIFGWAEIGIKSLLCGGLLKELAPVIEHDALEAMMTVNQEKCREILAYIESKV